LEHVSIRYRGASYPAVADVNFQLDEGTCIALVGESGSGKTTLGRAIARLLPPGAEVDGSMVSDGRVGYMMQDASSALNPIRKVSWQLRRAIEIRHPRDGGIQARSEELLRAAGIHSPSEIMGSYPHELSGGLAQRVLLATTLATEPKILVVDEPTSALDVTTQAQVMKLFRDLVNDGLSLVLITHDLAAAALVSDRIVVLNKGKVVEQGDTRAIVNQPQEDYTRRLLAAAMLSDDELANDGAGNSDA